MEEGLSVEECLEICLNVCNTCGLYSCICEEVLYLSGL